jgi:hypothetical protein
MEVKLYLDPRDIKAIFAQVGTAQAAAPWSGQAHAPDLSVIIEWRDRLWSRIERAIADIAERAERGKEQISKWVEEIEKMIRDMRSQIGERAEEVLAKVQELLFKACQGLQAAMLELLPATVTIRRQTAKLQDVGVQYQISVATTFVASLNWALQLASGANLSVSAKYAL